MKALTEQGSSAYGACTCQGKIVFGFFKAFQRFFRVREELPMCPWDRDFFWFGRPEPHRIWFVERVFDVASRGAERAFQGGRQERFVAPPVVAFFAGLQ